MAENELDFDLLQDLQVKFSLLPLEEEKEAVVPVTDQPDYHYPELGKREVLVKPSAFTLIAEVLVDLVRDLNKKEGDFHSILKEYESDTKLIKSIENAIGSKLTEEQKLRILKKTSHDTCIRSYWEALRIITYHSFKSRKIIQNGSEIIPIRTKRQFEYYFSGYQEVDRINPNHAQQFDDSENQRNTVLCYDGSQPENFEAFFEYVKIRIRGKLDRQIKRGAPPPLIVWKNRFKDELTIFFKAKVGGNGYAKDYQDSKVRELQRKGKAVKGLSETQIVKDAFIEAINSDQFDHQEYTCLIARNRGYSYLAISRFTGWKTKQIESIVEAALPKAARIVYQTFCKQYGKPETEEGFVVTLKLVKDLLSKQAASSRKD